MICPICRKKINFDLSGEPLPQFDFIENKWLHSNCLLKLKQRRTTAEEKKASNERQQLIEKWSTF
jgi:hypothetical protein